MTTTRDIETWLEKTALGDRDAFDRLYNATSAKLFGVCLRVLKERGASEDALQDVYLRIWDKAGMYQVNGLSPMTWLITLTRNLCIDRLRAARARDRENTVDDAAMLVPDSGPGPEALAVASSEAAALDVCLEELPADRAEAVRGAYMAGDTYAELAERYDVPLNTMRTWLRRSLIALKECLTR